MRKLYSYLSVAVLALAGAAQGHAETAFAVDPVPGVVEQFPTEFTVTFTDLKAISLPSPTVSKDDVVYIACPDGSWVIVPYMDKKEGMDYGYNVVLNEMDMNTNQLHVKLEQPLEDFGEFEVTIDTSRIEDISNGFFDATWIKTGQVKFIYDVTDEVLKDAKYTLNPASGSTLTTFPNLSVTFTDEQKIGLWGGDNPVATLTGPSAYYDLPKATVSGNVLTLTPSKQPIAEGTYKLTVYPSELTNSQDREMNFRNIEAEFEYQPEAMVPRAEIVPAPGKLRRMPAEIEITFPDFSTIIPKAALNPCVNISGPEDFDQNYFADNVAVGDLPSNIIKVTLNKDIQFPGNGEYTVTVPADAIIATPNAPLKDLVFKYTLDEAPEADVTVSPAGGPITEVPSRVSVTFNDLKAVKLVNTANTYFSVSGPSSYLKTYCAVVDSETPNMVYFDWFEGPTDSGAYTVTLDITGVKDADNADPMDYNDVKVTYILKVFEPNTYAVSITPKAGVVADLPDEITVSFIELDALSVDPGAKIAYVTGPNEYEEDLTVISNPDQPDSDLTIAWPNPPTETGEYVVTLVVAGITNVTTGEKLSGNNIVIKYRILGEPIATDYSVSPEAGTVEGFPAEVKFTFLDETIVIAGEGITPKADISGPNDFFRQAPVTNPEYKNTVTVKTSIETFEAGSYTITIYPQEFVNEDGVTLNYLPLSVTYDVKKSGIVEITGVSNEFDVYGVDGSVIVRKGTAEEYNALPAGIYIVGGKKVIKK